MSYARAWQRVLDDETHDVIVACNVPMFALARMRRYFARNNHRWVLWHQDVHSLGVAAEAERKLPGPACRSLAQPAGPARRGGAGPLGGRRRRNRGRLRRPVPRLGHRDQEVHVIKNWAPLNDLVPGERDNAWGRRQGLPTDAVRLLYAGTLGRKHNPQLLLELLDAVRGRGVNAVLTVVSEGVGADVLRAAAGDRADVRILGYQPAAVAVDVLASADAVVALLEPDAAQFSVPSKVLSYLSAGRPTIALVPGSIPPRWTSTTPAGVSPRPPSTAPAPRRIGCARSSRILRASFCWARRRGRWPSTASTSSGSAIVSSRSSTPRPPTASRRRVRRWRPCMSAQRERSPDDRRRQRPRD